MKTKHLWLPMIILTLIGGSAKICDTLFNLNGSGFFLNSTACNFIFIISVAVIFILGFILNFFDRKKNFETPPVKDTICGIFGFIASVSLIGGGIISMLNLGKSTSLAGDLILCIITLIGGIVMLFESCISFTGQNSMAKMPLLSLLVPLWCCGRFISLFMSYTKVSVHATEMFDIIFVALLLMFLFYQSMFLAQINTSTAVKRLTVYGITFVMCALVVTVDVIIKMTIPADSSNVDTYIVEPTVTKIISCIGDLAFCGYAIFFIKDIMQGVKKNASSAKATEENTQDSTTTAIKTESMESDSIENSSVKTVDEVKPAEDSAPVQTVDEVNPAENSVQTADEVKPTEEPVKPINEDEAYADIFKLLDEMSSKK